ncbi:MAG: molybdopterin-guanine dinucleotide biosynthesis protein B [Candidatus Bathyarchaeota archaeon]|nr:molybdopterin-guanine dinucleotide biosynthesis protein B [Candidatus Bathyarchaeota archaeon]
MVLVVAAVGTSGSGKTTTLEYLISHLSAEGYKIGSIKHVHHEGFTMDKEGTNTWRYAKAGSKVIVAISPEEIAMLKKTDAALNDLDQVIALLEREQLDVVFIEGFHSLIAKRTDVPKIITAEDEANLKRTLEGTAEPILAVTGVISQNKPQISGFSIPILDLKTDGKQLLQLIKGYLKAKPQQSGKTVK